MSNASKTIAMSMANLNHAALCAIPAIESLAKQIRTFKKMPLRFRVDPVHKVSCLTRKQLRAILRGRESLSNFKQPLPRYIKKKSVSAFKNDAVVWNTSDNGLDELKELYNQTKI